MGCQTIRWIDSEKVERGCQGTKFSLAGLLVSQDNTESMFLIIITYGILMTENNRLPGSKNCIHWN